MLPLHFVESWRIPSAGLFVAQQLRLGIYTALQLWLVVKTSCLGSHPECNLCTQTVWFFKPYTAVSNWGRAGRMFFILFVAVNWALSTFHTYGLRHYLAAFPALFSRSLAERWVFFAEDTQNDLTVWRMRELKRIRTRWVSRIKQRRRGRLSRHDPVPPWWVGFVLVFFLWYQDTTPVKTVIAAHRWEQAPASRRGGNPRPSWFGRVRSDLRLAARAPRFHRMAIALIVAVVLIASTEYAVKINLTEEANNWGFGQIFSVVAAVPFVASLARLVFCLGTRDANPR